MDLASAVAELEAAGTEQNRRSADLRAAAEAASARIGTVRAAMAGAQP
jgi:hypothetical protein